MLERWAGMADADTAVVQDAHLGGYPVCLLGIESRSVPRRGFPPTDGPDTYTAGHAVPAVVEEGRAGDQRGQRQPAAGGAGEPVGLRRVTGVDAQPAAGVRRRDRPRDRQLPRPDRVLRGLPLPRRRVRGLLQGAQPADDGAGARGLVRLGASAVRPPQRWCSPARWTSAPPRAPACATLDARVARGRRRRSGPPWSTELAELRAAVRAEKIGEVAAEFDGMHRHPPCGRGRVGRRGDPGARGCDRRSSARSRGNSRRGTEI